MSLLVRGRGILLRSITPRQRQTIRTAKCYWRVISTTPRLSSSKPISDHTLSAGSDVHDPEYYVRNINRFRIHFHHSPLTESVPISRRRKRSRYKISRTGSIRRSKRLKICINSLFCLSACRFCW
jgi:hypothetical protein